ncbi:MAG: DNA polymerase I [Gammaproteobacteria bacterium]
METAKKKLLILVDGSYYLFRAYHVPALQRLRNSRGEPTGAIFGTANMLRKLLQHYRPDYFAVVFDAKGKNFRHDIFPEYKAHRPPMPEELAQQIPPIHDLVRALGLPLLMIDGVEADDVIATLASRAAAGDIDTLISSGDKDLAQLVDDHIRLINTMENIIVDEEGVRKKYGVPPGRIVDYLILVGDSVDNVPGVPKVGPKTAAKWLEEYGSLENIIGNADQIPGKVGEYLRSSIDRFPLTRKLVTLKRDVEIDVAPDQLVAATSDRTALREQLDRWQIKSWSVDPALPSTPKESPGDNAACVYETILTEGELAAWLETLRNAELMAFDTETTSLSYIEAAVVGVSFAVSPERAAYLPLAHDYPGAPAQLDRDQTLRRLQPLLEDNGTAKVGHNLKYDMNVLANHGISLRGCRHDTMLESYVLDSVATRHDLDSLALKYLDKKTIHFEDVAGKGAKQVTFDKVPVDKAAEYAAEDAEVALRLHRALWPKVAGQPALEKLYTGIEMPLLPVLSRMERNGVAIDTNMLLEQSRQLSEQLRRIEEQAYDVAGESFNISSPKQIQAILYDKLGLPVLENTPTGQPSTAESVLQDLALEYELPRLILEYRTLSKLKSTYTDRLPEQVSPRTGRVHTSYHQAVAATGRLSSSDPNLQNIPVRTEEGRRIRQAFIAPPGFLLLAADYSQIELRIMAHLSGDRGLLASFARGEDIHKMTAAEVFGVKPAAVTPDQRRTAKVINFGLIYGMSAFGLARQLGIERRLAKAYVDRYFERYPGVKNYMDETRVRAREQGYVETIFKRRLYLPEIKSRNTARRQYAERTAINAPMQGSAADIIKRAMIAADNWIQDNRVNARLIMQVHDELVLEVEERGVDPAREALCRIMSTATELSVPLTVDIGAGKNWDQAH